MNDFEDFNISMEEVTAGAVDTMKSKIRKKKPEPINKKNMFKILSPGEMKFKTTLRLNLTSVRMALIKRTNRNKC